jgi:hypothetical protein
MIVENHFTRQYNPEDSSEYDKFDAHSKLNWMNRMEGTGWNG